MKRRQRDTRLEQPGHFVGLKFKEGWWFIQILGTSVQELKPWVLLNENGNRAAIGAETTGNNDEIQDERNRILLEPNDDERGLVFQILMGVEPSRMNIIPQFGREQNLGLEEQLAAGEDEVWITGFDSPYNNPSSQSEIIYINDMAPLRIRAHNPMTTSDEVKLSFLVNKMHYATVTSVNVMKAMLQNQIRSSKKMVGLGATENDQLSAPEWLENTFGEHIKPTETILQQGDGQQGVRQAGNLIFRDSVDLEGAERQSQAPTGGGR